MELENKPQIKDGWTKLDSNYYRQLEVEIFKMRYGNLWLGLLTGFFLGVTYAAGWRMMALYMYYSTFMTSFVYWFPLGFGIFLIMLSLSLMLYRVLYPLED